MEKDFSDVDSQYDAMSSTTTESLPSEEEDTVCACCYQKAAETQTRCEFCCEQLCGTCFSDCAGCELRCCFVCRYYNETHHTWLCEQCFAK